jgi:Putative zinc-finger
VNAFHGSRLLGAYVLGTLDPTERNDLDSHLANCAECTAELTGLEAVRDMLDEVPPEALLHGPPDADLVLQRTLRQIRTEAPQAGWRRRTLAVAVAAAVLAGAGAAGVLVGRGTAPAGKPTAAASTPAGPASPLPSGLRVATTVDPRTHVRLTASVTPASGWVRVNAAINGIPAGQDCRLIVLGRDGQREVAGGWVVSAVGARDGTDLDGSAAVAPGNVVAVQVVNTAGHVFVTLPI